MNHINHAEGAGDNEKILIVGATGQLGTRITDKLSGKNRQVRAFVRENSQYRHLEQPGVELVFGDLRNPDSVDEACRGVTHIIATANAVVGRTRGDELKSVDGDGYNHLIEAAKKHNIQHLVWISVPVTLHDNKVPQFRWKRTNETRIQESGIPYTIFRAAMFSEVWPAMLGSQIPLNGEKSPTLERPFWFLNLFRKATGIMIEKKGKAMVPGTGGIRNSFIAIDNVADFMVSALDRPDAINRIYEIGGPAHLSWDEVVNIFEKLLDKKIKVSYTPAVMFKIISLLFKPFSPSVSSIMAVNWLAAKGSLEAYDTHQLAGEFGIRLTPFEEFLEAKLLETVNE